MSKNKNKTTAETTTPEVETDVTTEETTTTTDDTETTDTTATTVVDDTTTDESSDDLVTNVVTETTDTIDETIDTLRTGINDVLDDTVKTVTDSVNDLETASNENIVNPLINAVENVVENVEGKVIDLVDALDRKDTYTLYALENSNPLEYARVTKRLNSLGYTFTSDDSTYTVIVARFNTMREAIVARKKLQGKGLKPVIK